MGVAACSGPRPEDVVGQGGEAGQLASDDRPVLGLFRVQVLDVVCCQCWRLQTRHKLDA